MKYFKLKHPVSFPITACWGITATKHAVIIYLGLRGFVIELPQRKLTKRAPDAPDWVCRNCDAENPPINTNCFNCNGTARW